MPDNPWYSLIEWNSQVPTERLNCCVHTLFRAQCLLQPEAEAICAWDGSLSYHELDKESSKIQAELIKTYGVQKESIVPLLFEKSKWAVIAMLGVLKAGAAFVMIDPSCPRSRIQDIIGEVEATVMMCSEKTEFDCDWGARVFSIVDIDWRRKDDLPASETPSSDAVYIAYTSGSTGKPKGVIIEHGSFCTNALASSKAQKLDGTSRVLQFASYAFDVSIHESLTPLVLGGCVCIPSEFQRMNNLKDAVEKLRVNWAELTPSVSKILQPEDIPSVQTLILGGEPMAPEDIRRWQGKVHLMCAYGPAECTVVSTVQSNVTEPNNIGRPLGGSCWIVNKDDHNRLVAIGDVGELLIAGPIVGRGYLKQPKQTEAVFISNPDWGAEFHITEHQRFYKTGDLACWKEDGSIIYWGRKDNQVKFHGQRVELGEIEHHAEQYFQNQHVVAELAKEKMALVLFVAEKLQFSDSTSPYFTPDDPTDQFQIDMRHATEQLLCSLPTFMVPTVYIPLRELPITKSGKVDRKLLRDIADRLPDARLRVYRPSFTNGHSQSSITPIHQNLQRLFAEVLELPVEEIGIHNSFFELGGDSIRAMTLAGLARSDCILPVTVESIFKYQSISKIVENAQSLTSFIDNDVPPFSLLCSHELDSIISCAVDQCSVPRDQIEDIYPCTPLQEAMMTYSLNNPASFQARFYFHFTESLDIPSIQVAWKIVIRANPILRTRIIQTDALRMQQVVIRDEEPLWDLMAEFHKDSPKPLISFGSPLVRFGIARERSDSGPLMLTLTMHHSVFDGWSYQCLVEDADCAFRYGICRPKFAPFIKYISRIDLESAKIFWNKEFKGLKAVSFPATSSSPGYVPEIVSTLSSKMKLSKKDRAGYTLSNVIKLAFAMIIATATHSNDVVFGLTVTGRNAPVPNIGKLAAPTIATLPLRTIIDPDLTVEETLLQMQNHTAQLIPFEQVGLRQIKQFGPEAAAACEFQSLLVIQPYIKKIKRKRWWYFKEASGNSREQLSFCAHPLTMVCELLKDNSLDVTAVFDAAVLRHDQVERLVQRFHKVLMKITDSPTSRMNSVMSFRSLDIVSEVPSSPPTKPPVSHHIKQPAVPEAQVLKLREIVARALNIKVEEIGPYDNFLVAGGDSISAMHVVTLCRKEGLQLTARDIFKAGSIEHIAVKLKPIIGALPTTSHNDAAGTYIPFSLLPFTSQGELEIFNSHVARALHFRDVDQIEDAYPCTAVHQGLLFTQSLEKFNYRSYTIWEVFDRDIGGHASPVRLCEAWKHLVKRHPALRTVFWDSVDGQTASTCSHIVLKSLTQETTICSYEWEYEPSHFRKIFRKPFRNFETNYPTGFIPYSFNICCTDEGRVFGKLEGSRAFLDASSVLIILRELSAIYNGQTLQAPGPLYSTAVKYFRDFTKDVDYRDSWLKQLAGVKPCIFPRLGKQDKQELQIINSHLCETATLKHFCTKHRFTVGNVFEVAWALVLQQYTGLSDICFGSLVSGRDAPIPDIQDIIGSFFNILVCRLRLDNQKPILDVLEKNQLDIGNRLQDQHRPLTDVLRLSDSFGSPLFNTCISIEPQLSTMPNVDGIHFQEVETHEPTEYGIVAAIVVEDQTVTTRLTYWSSVLKEKDANTLLETFRSYISVVLGAGDSKLN